MFSRSAAKAPAFPRMGARAGTEASNDKRKKHLMKCRYLTLYSFSTKRTEPVPCFT